MIFGYVPDEVQAMARIEGLLGKNLFDRARLAALGRNQERRARDHGEGGERRHLLVHIKEVSIKGSSVLYVCRDVTERMNAVEELRAARVTLAHASRLALVGQFAASIAHEINQPLTSICNNASAGLHLLQKESHAAQADELREIFGDISEESRRAVDVIERVRALAGRRPLDRQTLDVNEVAREIVRLVGSEARRRGVTLRTELEPSLPAIAANRVCLQQVMLNLMMNAMDAMDAESEQRQVIVRTRRLDADVEVAVSDSGHGISPDHAPRLFDAFFTTKEEGLGLGLAIVRSIVEAHDGRIWADYYAGRGATFHLTLPVNL